MTDMYESPSFASVEAAFKPYLTATPRVAYVPAYDPMDGEWAGIRALTYDGATIAGQKTKVFAYIGFPEGACAAHPVPAVVLVHGGGGHAFTEWIRLWTDRGYGAIAMDTTGFFPSEKGRGIAGGENDDPSLWHYGLYGPFAEEGYVNAPNNDNVSTSARPLEQQWLFHAVVSTMVAHNILRADPRVDVGKIGITGISWGGDITSVAIGYDTDYAFAVPVYGSGYLCESHGYQGPIFSEEHTRRLWSPETRFAHIGFPVMWLGWANDTPFSINSQSRSYLDTKAVGGVMNVKLAWYHSHGCGWAPKDTFLFADAATGRRGRQTAVTDEPVVEKMADGTYRVTAGISPDGQATAITVEAVYITAPLSYSCKEESHPTIDQVWQTVGGEVSDTRLTVFLPKEAVDFYLCISTTTKAEQYDVSSRFVQGLG